MRIFISITLFFISWGIHAQEKNDIRLFLLELTDTNGPMTINKTKDSTFYNWKKETFEVRACTFYEFENGDHVFYLYDDGSFKSNFYQNEIQKDQLIYFVRKNQDNHPELKYHFKGNKVVRIDKIGSKKFVKFYQP